MTPSHLFCLKSCDVILRQSALVGAPVKTTDKFQPVHNAISQARHRTDVSLHPTPRGYVSRFTTESASESAARYSRHSTYSLTVCVTHGPGSGTPCRHLSASRRYLKSWFFELSLSDYATTVLLCDTDFFSSATVPL